MNGTVSQKEELLMMLNQINKELDDLDAKVKDSFSGLKSDLNKVEHSKISIQANRIARMEEKQQVSTTKESSLGLTLQAAL